MAQLAWVPTTRALAERMYVEMRVSDRASFPPIREMVVTMIERSYGAQTLVNARGDPLVAVGASMRALYDFNLWLVATRDDLTPYRFAIVRGIKQFMAQKRPPFMRRVELTHDVKIDVSESWVAFVRGLRPDVFRGKA